MKKTVFWTNYVTLNVKVPQRLSSLLKKLNVKVPQRPSSLLKKEENETITISLPLPSMILFASAVTVVEYPGLLPSFFFGVIACVLLFKNPGRASPILSEQSKPFIEFIQTLLFGKPLEATPKFTFDPAQIEMWREKEDEFEKFVQESRALGREKKAIILAENLKVIQLEEQHALAYLKDDSDYTIMKKFVPESLLTLMIKAQDFPVMMLVGLSFASDILSWRESYYSFWISVFSIFLAIANLFMPWKLIFRCIVWTIFGPWMKLVGEIVNKPKPPPKVDPTLSWFFGKLPSVFQKASMTLEKRYRCDAMKSSIFGKFCTEISPLKPIPFLLREHRPLDSSYANPYVTENKEVIIDRIPGQNVQDSILPDLDKLRKSTSTTGEIALKTIETPVIPAKGDDVANSDVNSNLFLTILGTWAFVSIPIAFVRQFIG